jgi:hypothetical protein
MSREHLQVFVLLIILGGWVTAVLCAVFDGDTALKAVTPVTTIAFGWLFAERVTS